jgi:aryl-alcohol dehydrogenase-like predicted oxidoreductase
MATRRLGSNGPEVFPLALGCAGLSGAHRQLMDDAESIATIQEAIDRGVNVVDTADFYGGGHNELLIAKAIQGRRDKVVLSDKFGGLRSPDGAFVGIDGRPAAVKNFLTYSLTRLGVDYIDIYRPARLDPHVPIEETIGAISDLVEGGYVRHVGLSEVGPETIRRACAVLPICDLQIEYSVMTRGPEADIFLVLHELGVAVTAYGVLMHGLLSGAAKPAGDGDPRAHLPRFRGDNFDRNQRLVAAFGEIARDKGVTNSQLAVAWVLAKGPDIVPVVGARKRTQLQDVLGGLDIVLSAEDLARIERSVPPEAVSGMRYDPRLMAMLDSERTSSTGV